VEELALNSATATAAGKTSRFLTIARKTSRFLTIARKTSRVLDRGGASSRAAARLRRGFRNFEAQMVMLKNLAQENGA
jgi:hypothetical protein